jgi:CRP/FNR family transcriptional regulator
MSIDGKFCNCEGCQLQGLFLVNITDVDLNAVCNSKEEINYKKGEIIVEQGKPVELFMYLRSGLVKLFKKGEYRDQIIKIARPMDFVSILSVFSTPNYRYSVVALEDSTVCYLEFSLVKEMVLKNGQFALNLLEKMSQMTDDIIATNLDISKKNLRGRIAYLLLYFSRHIFDNKVYDLPLSRKEIAEFIEMTTENVIRTMSEFRKDGIIDISGKTISIMDERRLEQIMALG